MLIIAARIDNRGRKARRVTLVPATDPGSSGDENRKRKAQASCVYSGKHYPTTALIKRDRWQTKGSDKKGKNYG